MRPPTTSLLSETIQWGMIGCGDVTKHKSGPAFFTLPHTGLVAVTSRNMRAARAYAQQHDIKRCYPSAEELVADPLVHAIYIATPPSSHAEYCFLAARARKPVYVEKPMARTYRECLLMNYACQRAGVPLFVAYYRRRLPSFVKIKELIDEGAIGEARCVTVELFQPPKEEKLASKTLPWRVVPEVGGPGGYFYDLASHQLDFLDYVLGPVTAVNGLAKNQTKRYAVPDIFAANFTFQSGAVGSGAWCFTVSPHEKLDRIQMFGSAGKIQFSTFEETPIQLWRKGELIEFKIPKPACVEQALIESVVAELRGEGDCPSTGTTAARTSWVMEEIVRKS